MHSSAYDSSGGAAAEAGLNGVDVLVAITTLVTEGRIPDKVNTSLRGYSEGPHCHKSKSSANHQCDDHQFLCSRYETLSSHVFDLWKKSIPLCVEVLLTADCECGKVLANTLDISGDDNSKSSSPIANLAGGSNVTDSAASTTGGTAAGVETLLLEQWYLTVETRRSKDASSITTQQLLNAVRSQLHFSQLAAWLSIKPPDNNNEIQSSSPLRPPNTKNIIYRLTIPNDAFKKSKFDVNHNEHHFPLADIGNNNFLKISMYTLPRLEQIPKLQCLVCKENQLEHQTVAPCCRQNNILDDRMHFSCTKHGKHKCTYDDEDLDLDLDNRVIEVELKHKSKVRCLNPHKVDKCVASTSRDLIQSIIQNQPRVTTVNYFLVPSTSSCSDHQKSTYSVERMPPADVASKAPVLTASSGGHYQYDSTTKTNQTSGYHEHTGNFLGVNNNKYEFSSSSCCSQLLGNNSGNQLLANSIIDLNQDDLNGVPSKSDILLNAIMRSSKRGVKSVLCGGRRDVCKKMLVLRDAVDVCDECKCDNLNDNSSSDIQKKVYSFTNNYNPMKSQCDSLESTNNNNNKSILSSNIKDQKTSPKKLLQLDKLQICNGTIPKHGALFGEHRHKLYKNAHAMETKRKIHFDDNKDAKSSNGYEIEQVLLGDEVDRECAMYTQNLTTDVPTALEQKNFRKSLDNAASMVFHSRTGLPLTSSPAPIRKGAKCFDFDSKLNSVSAIRSALFELNTPNSVADEDSESDSSAVSPCSSDAQRFAKKHRLPVMHFLQSRSGLLGTFEESVLHGRLEPVSTVQGFTAELGASGLFCPSHKTFPVTVFFYSLGDMDRMSVPYLGHINLGKKGYNVPKSGLVQLTLFNPLGTVVKMFVVSYDLSDMPPNSQTFIRQRTLYLPQDCPELQRADLQYNDKWGHKYLRFLIHLRFMCSKSGRIYLHTDVRMIIFNKSDMDTATGLIEAPGHEMRSFTYYPTNPKYSPSK